MNDLDELQTFIRYGENLLKYSTLAFDGFGRIWRPFNKASLVLHLCCFIYVPLQVMDAFFPDSLIPGPVKTKVDFSNMVRRLSFFVIQFQGGFVAVLWYMKRTEILNHTITLLQKAGYFKKACSARHQDIVLERSKNNRKLAQFYSTCCWGIAFTATIGSLLVTIFKGDQFTVKWVDDFNRTRILYTQPLPYYCWIPLNYRKSKIAFATSVSLVTIPNLILINAILGVDTIFIGLGNLVRVHFELLKHSFKTSYERCEEKVKQKYGRSYSGCIRDLELNIEMEKELKLLVIYHNDILHYCKTVGFYVSNVIFVEIFAAVLFLSFLLYVVQDYSNLGVDIFAATVVLLFSWISRTFLMCSWGQTIMVDDLEDSVYDNNWIATRKSYKSSMLLILIRMKKLPRIRIGKFEPLNLAIFVQILKAGYSFFAVMRSTRLHKV